VSVESRAVELARQRERLIARAEAQRHELAAHVRRWEVPLRVADKALAGARFLRANPVVVAAAAVALLVFGRRRLWTIVRGGLIAWRAWRAVRSFVDKLPSGPARGTVGGAPQR